MDVLSFACLMLPFPTIAGVLVLLDVLAVYAYALRNGQYPPSSPWSGIALVVLAVGLLRRSSGTVPPRVSRWMAVAAVVAAGLWTVAAVLG